MTSISQEVAINKRVSAVVAADGALFALAVDSFNHCEILHVSDGKATSVAKFEISGYFALFYHFKLAVTDTDFWVGASSLGIHRVSRKDGAVTHYSIAGTERRIEQIVVSPNNDVWITACWNSPVGLTKYSIAVYLWDHKTGSFVTNPHKPSSWKDSELSYAMAFKDSRGNVLCSYRNKNNEASATLTDAHGDLFDYTVVMSNHELAYSEDFKQDIIFHSPGLRFVDVALRNAVKKITTVKTPRQMVELDSRTIITGRTTVLSYSNGAWQAKDTIMPCIGNMFIETQDISMDDIGHIWFEERFPGPPVVYNLMRYRPREGLCDTFDFGGYNFMFDFMDDGQMVQAFHGNVYLWDKHSAEPRLIVKQAYQEASVNQIFAGKEGFAWLATPDGLLKIDPKKESNEWVDLIPGQTINVMRIHQDKKGRLWLGTVMNGILIFDPSSGKTQQIDQTNGLSNNIVVSLLEDDDGDIWAGTFLWHYRSFSRRHGNREFIRRRRPGQ